MQTHPDKTQAERAYDLGLSRHCIGYNLQKLEISRKKTTRYTQCDPVQRRNFLCLRECYRRQGKHFIDIDESGFELQAARRFGYASHE